MKVVLASSNAGKVKEFMQLLSGVGMEGAGAAACNEKLLHALKDVPEAKRTARFRCCIVMLQHAADPSPIIAEGRWEGRILDQLTGTEGFGYDPLFYVPTHNMSAAQMDSAEKNLISHRAQALQGLLERLK